MQALSAPSARCEKSSPESASSAITPSVPSLSFMPLTSKPGTRRAGMWMLVNTGHNAPMDIALFDIAASGAGFCFLKPFISSLPPSLPPWFLC